jgi:uncharacterized protein DUF3467
MEKSKFIKDEPKTQDLNQVEITANLEVQKGVYSNFAIIQHAKNEFMIDFHLKFGSQSQLVSRVILSPNQMKALSKAILENIEKFNIKHNRINDESNYDSY